MGDTSVKPSVDYFSSVKRFAEWIFSVPILIKIMGTGFVVALIFGSILLIETRSTLSEILCHILEEKTISMAEALATHIERPLVIGDLFAIKRRLTRSMEAEQDLCYIIVESRDGTVLIHTFEKSVPEDLVGLRASQKLNNNSLEVFGSEKGRIFEAKVPLIEGSMGFLRLGMKDQMVTSQLSSFTRLLLLTLVFCMAVGLGLALLLTYILTRPIQNLLLATNRISEAKFESRAQVYSNDEIGKLAVSFNRMAKSLQEFSLKVKEEGKARQALIEKIVLTQEEERRSISRDLHDQLGQSLSALLLDIQSMDDSKHNSGILKSKLEDKTHNLINEVRHLAWGMHPSILDDYGLNKALARYINEISQSSGIKIEYQSLCPPELERLSMRTEVTLYRIAQEAITNIVRHSNAKDASVILMQNKKDTLLLIEDSGSGFDLKSFEQGGSSTVGLVGMRERAALLGAEFTVESTLSKGTTIRVTIS
jgi:signal transduction histidine kinase